MNENTYENHWGFSILAFIFGIINLIVHIIVLTFAWNKLLMPIFGIPFSWKESLIVSTFIGMCMFLVTIHFQDKKKDTLKALIQQVVTLCIGFPIQIGLVYLLSWIAG